MFFWTAIDSCQCCSLVDRLVFSLAMADALQLPRDSGRRMSLTRSELRQLFRGTTVSLACWSYGSCSSWTGSPWQRPKRVQQRWLNLQWNLSNTFGFCFTKSIYLFQSQIRTERKLTRAASLRRKIKGTTQDSHRRVKCEGCVGRQRQIECLHTQLSLDSRVQMNWREIVYERPSHDPPDCRLGYRKSSE